MDPRIVELFLNFSGYSIEGGSISRTGNGYLGSLNSDGSVTVEYGVSQQSGQIDAALGLRDYCWNSGVEVQQKAAASVGALARQLDNRAQTSGLAARLRQTSEDIRSAA